MSSLLHHFVHFKLNQKKNYKNTKIDRQNDLSTIKQYTESLYL